MAGGKVGEAYVELQARMTKFEAQLKSAERLTGKSVGRMQAKFQALAPTLRKVGIGMAVAGGAITAALGLAIKSSISFNKEMANIATLIPGATKRVIELKGAIRTMAVDVGKDTADLAQGAYQVISAFGDTADTVAILKMSARAATAGVATTTDAINLLSAVTKGYGDTSKEAVQKASDLAFQTVTLGQTTFPELAASIGKAIPLAAELGIAEEELFTVMAAGTGVTGKAAEVSTQLRGIFQSFLAPTADMTKLLEDMGYKTGKAMLAEEGLHGALQSIIKAAEDSGMPLQKYISSIEGQTIALALTGAQSDTYIEKLAKMRDSVGLTDVAFKEQTEGINKTGFAFQQAKIRIGVLGQEIGDRLLPMITPLIEKVTEIVKRISDWSKEHPKLTGTIVKVAAVLGPLLIALGALMMILPGIVAIAPMVGAAFTIMTGPIGIIVMAIAAATAAFIYFYKTNEKFRDYIDKSVAGWILIGKVIWEFVKVAGANLKNWANWLLTNFPKAFSEMGANIIAILTNIGSNIGKAVGRFVEIIKHPIKAMKGELEKIDWTPIFEGVKWTVEGIPPLIKMELGKAVKEYEAKIKEIEEVTATGMKKVTDEVEKGSEGVAGAINTIRIATEKYIPIFDKLQKLRKKEIELTEEEKKRIKELEEAQKAAQEEIARLRKMSFEEWQAQNEARTKELYAEVDKQKKIQKDAKDEIAKIRATSFEEWQKQNEARTKELYTELATQKQIQQNAKDEIIDIRKMSFEDWKKKNEARTKELYKELTKQKQIQKDAKDEIIDIRKISFEDWQKKNEARTKELYAELAVQKQIEQDAKNEIADIRKMSFEDWKKKNKARVQELKAALTKRKKQQESAKDEIAKIRKESFEDWKAKNDARVKELEDALEKRKRLQKDAKDEIAKIRKTSFEEWKEQNAARVKDLEEKLQKMKDYWETFYTSLKTGFSTVVADWLGGTGTLGDAFKKLGSVIKDVVIKAIADLIAMKLVEWFISVVSAAKAATAAMSAFAASALTTIGIIGAFIVVAKALCDAVNKIVIVFDPAAISIEEMGRLMEYLTNQAAGLNKKIIEMLDLWIQVEDELGEGSEAKLRWIYELYKEWFEKIGILFEDLWGAYTDLMGEAEEETENATDNMAASWNSYDREVQGKARKTWGKTGVVPTAVKEATTAMGKDTVNAIDEMTRTIGKLPKKIDFDVVGHLHMPTIPQVGDQSFTIYGKYRGPSIPSYQTGIPYVPRTTLAELHPREAVLTAPQAREWRAGGGGAGGDVIFQRGAVQMRVQNLNTKADKEELVGLVEETMTRTIDKKMRSV